ncbi:MAG: hypothetical protein J0L75_11865 [Spirochaetes bacterium]|nr:hypothetical protein [Spirochaetota bacterium]
MLRFLIPVSAIAALFLASCTTDSGARDDHKKNEAKLPPAQLAFISIKNQLAGVDWNKAIDGQKLKPVPGLVGFQIGLKVPNLTLALFTRNDQAAKGLTQDIIDLSKAIDIDDEAVLLQIKDRATRINTMVQDTRADNYGDLLSELAGIEQIIKVYFKSRGNDTVIQQVVFGTWLEFLHISLGVQLNQNLAESLPGFFSRAAEISYFREKFKKAGVADPELEFLKKNEPYLNAPSGKTLTRDQMLALEKSVGELRARYGVK